MAEASSNDRGRLSRAFGGLAIGLSLSLINLVGASVALWSFGGLGEWSRAQFVGMFGVLEMATGVISIFGPNVWRLPVAQAQTSEHTDIRLALSTSGAYTLQRHRDNDHDGMFIPHWAASAKTIAGSSAGVVLLIAFIATTVAGATLAVVRFGVTRPDFDVWGITIHRAGHPDRRLPAFSITPRCSCCSS